MGCLDKVKTNIYHITYAPAEKQVSLFFWGCNFGCRGCLSKKNIYNFLLNENLHLPFDEPAGIASPPQVFLSLEEVFSNIDRLDIKRIILEGQEASIDPQYRYITKSLHERYNCPITLCTNLHKLPPLEYTDSLGVSIKAITPELHLHYTGKPNSNVLANFKLMHKAGYKMSVATVLIPDYIDVEEIEKIAEFIESVDTNIYLNILPYFKAGDNPWHHPEPQHMGRAIKAARKHLSRVDGWVGTEEMEYEVNNIYPLREAMALSR